MATLAGKAYAAAQPAGRVIWAAAVLASGGNDKTGYLWAGSDALEKADAITAERDLSEGRILPQLGNQAKKAVA